MENSKFVLLTFLFDPRGFTNCRMTVLLHWEEESPPLEIRAFILCNLAVTKQNSNSPEMRCLFNLACTLPISNFQKKKEKYIAYIGLSSVENIFNTVFHWLEITE
jgi:hypothetical protein